MTYRSLLFLVAGIYCGLLSTTSNGQTIYRHFPADAPPPVVTWNGLVPGQDKFDAAVMDRLGIKAEPLAWYGARKFELKAPGRDDVTDNVLAKGDLVVGTLELVTPLPGFETLSAIAAKIGPPEHTIILSRQSIVDYASKGYRFIANNADGKVVGTACFPPRRRVPAGELKVLDLSKQVQGPLPPVQNARAWEGLKVGFASRPLGLDEEMIKGMAKDDQLRKPLDVLQVRCCYVSHQGQSVALLGADIFGMLRLDLVPVFTKLASEGYPNVVVGLSHVHCAPDTIGVYGFLPNQYLRSVQKAVYDCVRAAAEATQPASQVKVVSVELPLDGARVAGISRNVRNPGLVNPQLGVVTFHAADDRVIGTLINYACHPEILDGDHTKLFASDFVGPLREYVDNGLGGTTVFVNAALGGMVTGDTPGRRVEDIKLLGDRLGKQVVEYAKRAQPSPEQTLRFIKRPIEIPPTNLKFKGLAAAKGANKSLVDNRLPTELNYIRIGSAEFITIPGELFPEIGFEIQARMTGYPRMIVCLANDELGYIVPGYDFNEKNYEESMSVGAAMGPMIQMAAWELASKGATMNR